MRSMCTPSKVKFGDALSSSPCPVNGDICGSSPGLFWIVRPLFESMKTFSWYSEFVWSDFGQRLK